MRMISLYWSYNRGEGTTSFSRNFNESHIVVQLDLLQDCIYDLQQKYDALLNQPKSEVNL